MSTLEERKKSRKELEEKLKEVPEGERIHIEKEKLDSLIFEQYLIEDENIMCKFPIWTGDFLTKLDLSELDFADVCWSIHGNPMFDTLFYEELKEYDMLSSNENNFSNTNARIDLSQSIEARYYNTLYIVGCNFENVDLSFNDLSQVNDGCILNCNLKNTGLRIEYSNSYEEWNAIENYRGETSKEELAVSLASGRLDGCYINNIQIDSTQIQSPLQYLEQLASAYNSGDIPKGGSHK